MPLIIVEYVFDPPISEEDFDQQAEKTMDCLEARGVTWVTSYMAIDRRRRICVFEARDAEAVRQAYRNAGTRFERIWTAEQITDED